MKWKHFPCYWTFVRGIHRSPVNSPHIKASDAELWCFFYLRLNKRLSKQSWGWWFATPSRPFWRHRNVAGTFRSNLFLMKINNKRSLSNTQSCSGCEDTHTYNHFKERHQSRALWNYCGTFMILRQRKGKNNSIGTNMPCLSLSQNNMNCNVYTLYWYTW